MVCRSCCQENNWGKSLYITNASNNSKGKTFEKKYFVYFQLFKRNMLTSSLKNQPEELPLSNELSTNKTAEVDVKPSPEDSHSSLGDKSEQNEEEISDTTDDSSDNDDSVELESYKSVSEIVKEFKTECLERQTKSDQLQNEELVIQGGEELSDLSAGSSKDPHITLLDTEVKLPSHQGNTNHSSSTKLEKSSETCTGNNQNFPKHIESGRRKTQSPEKPKHSKDIVIRNTEGDPLKVVRIKVITPLSNQKAKMDSGLQVNNQTISTEIRNQNYNASAQSHSPALLTSNTMQGCQKEPPEAVLRRLLGLSATATIRK